jgi:hypothetical protein
MFEDESEQGVEDGTGVRHTVAAPSRHFPPFCTLFLSVGARHSNSQVLAGALLACAVACKTEESGGRECRGIQEHLL